MSEQRSFPPEADPSANPESCLEALRASPSFRGPAESLDGHAHANDHFALVYDSREEQFAAAVPFIRQGLDRGERCVYIAYENSREDVLAAMRECGVDVDAALDSGQLSVHDETETYLRNETFDADETVAFLDAAIDAADEEYEGLRVTGEMSSVLEEDPDGEELVRCEAKANYLFDDVDGIALCQYNRNRFPSDVIRDVISTHPLLVHDGRVSHNVYYTPPEEFFGPEKSEREVDRLLGSLGDQTDAKAELRRRERYLRESYRITADPALDFEEKLHRLLDLARERMDLDAAGLTHLPEQGGELLTEYAIGYGNDDGDGDGESNDDVVDASDDVWTDPGEGCFCRQVLAEDEPVGKADVRGTEWEDDEIHREHGLSCYLGTKVTSGSTPYGTLWVGSTEPRERPFSETERTFLELMGQWVSYELDRRRRERELRERTEHLSALIETAPECIKTVAADGTLLQMNPAGLEMVEADSADAVTGECIYDVIAPEDRERFREFNERICSGERGTLEFDIVGLNGTRRHMESHAAPLHNPDGTTAHVALTRDVTEQFERERELEETIEKLEESNERLESFASMLAHELRNPVAIGQIYSQRLPTGTDAAAVEYVTEAFDRIEDMVDVMLVLTRGREAVGDRAPVDLAETVRTAWGDVEAPDASLDVDLDRTIEADETYLRHLFRNLLQNAVEHGSTSRRPQADDVHQTESDAAHQKSSISEDAVEHGSTSPRSQPREDAVEHGGPDVAVTVGYLPTGFYVADDGPGIHPEDRDAVFEPGYTTAEDAGGTGLGLAFVRKLVEVYEWECTVAESDAGGARFEFRNVF
ncbi:MEDS domain-containing protein [Halorussus rarus]|uniref:MEDS domain-containing protein n=1 Tax=Halorussus TaxID=1070314 RepID=UPI001877F98B|nr:MEDS domain-containing protein [Halorussus rarus]